MYLYDELFVVHVLGEGADGPAILKTGPAVELHSNQRLKDVSPEVSELVGRRQRQRRLAHNRGHFCSGTRPFCTTVFNFTKKRYCLLFSFVLFLSFLFILYADAFLAARFAAAAAFCSGVQGLRSFFGLPSDSASEATTDSASEASFASLC